jgi:hypothetical protein
MGEVLDLVVDRQGNLAPVLGQADRLNVLDDVAAAVLHHPAGAGLARQLGLEGQLNALLALVINAGKAQHMGHHVATRVETTVLPLIMDARQFERRDPIRQLGRHLALEVDEILVAGQLLVELADRQAPADRPAGGSGRDRGGHPRESPRST